MDKKENMPKANKPIRDDDKIKKSDLPYDPNINKEDKQALQERGHSMNPTDDKFLADREKPVDFAAKDLDIPGRRLADTTGRGTDLIDEENFQYDKSGVKKKSFNEGKIPDEDTTNR